MLEKVDSKWGDLGLAAMAWNGLDVASMWLLPGGTLVMFMHAGIAMLEAGCCRVENAFSVLMKNLVNVGVSSLAWRFFG